MRGFARHRSATDPRTQIPPDGLLPYRRQAGATLPLLGRGDPALAACGASRCRALRTAALRPWTYYCLFGLLSVSGLRLGEARNLELQDVDLQAGVLTIRGAKFGKSRWSPCIRRLHACWRTTSRDATDIGHGRPCLPTSSSPAGAIGWMAARSTERSMPYPGRSVCAVHLTVMGRVFTTSVIDSR